MSFLPVMGPSAQTLSAGSSPGTTAWATRPPYCGGGSHCGRRTTGLPFSKPIFPGWHVAAAGTLVAKSAPSSTATAISRLNMARILSSSAAGPLAG